MQRLYFFILFFFPALLQGQAGCTDPLATNFDADAIQNDGSCLYPETNVSTQILNNLPNELPECSGMVGYENYWITINDGGGGHDLLLLDKSTGDFIRKVVVLEATNVDWEAIAIYGNVLYIGDFGNNDGNRTNLGIYTVALSDLEQDEIVSSFFPFTYQDQVNFNPDPNNHPFDCEAMIVTASGIHLFTKGWNAGIIGHYTLDLNDIEPEALKVEEFNINGLVTGASMDENGTLGFTGIDGNAFLWLFYDYDGQTFFTGNKRKIGLGFLGQNESLFFSENKTAWITSEDTFQPGKIYFLDYNLWIVSGANYSIEPEAFDVYPNPFSSNIFLNWRKNTKASYSLTSITGLIVNQGNLHFGQHPLPLNVPSGAYILTIKSEGKFARTLVIKQ